DVCSSDLNSSSAPGSLYVLNVIVPGSSVWLIFIVLSSALTFIADVANSLTSILYVPFAALDVAVAVTALSIDDVTIFELYVLLNFISSIILSSSKSALLISRNPSRFHSNVVLSCSIRSNGIRSAAIIFSIISSVFIPEANPPILIYVNLLLNFLVDN